MKAFKNAIVFSTYIFIIWGFYRFLFQLPETYEELIIKPIVWLLPVFYLVNKEKEGLYSIGITLRNIFPTIYYSIGLGALFLFIGLFFNFIKYKGEFNFGANIGSYSLLSSFAISFATAISEEISFRGYVFTRIWKFLNNELYANIITSVFWALIHVPVTIFVWKLDLASSLVFLFITTLFGMGSAFVFARTKNIISPIFLHVLWQWPIILFR